MTLNNKVVYHFAFDEGSGSTTTDSKASLTGTLSNTNLWTSSSKLGSHAIDFGVGNQHIALADGGSGFNFLHDGSTKWTINLWFYNKGDSNVNGGRIMTNTRGANVRGIEYHTNSNRRISFNVGRTTPWPALSFTSEDNVLPAEDGWVMLTITCDPDRETECLRLYVNNVPAGTANRLNEFQEGNSDQDRVMHLGRYVSESNYLNNAIDSLTFFNDELDEGERTVLYNGGEGRTYPFPQSLIIGGGDTNLKFGTGTSKVIIGSDD